MVHRPFLLLLIVLRRHVSFSSEVHVGRTGVVEDDLVESPQAVHFVARYVLGCGEVVGRFSGCLEGFERGGGGDVERLFREFGGSVEG